MVPSSLTLLTQRQASSHGQVVPLGGRDGLNLGPESRKDHNLPRKTRLLRIVFSSALAVSNLHMRKGERK